MDGKQINSHIPQYMASAPWYLSEAERSRKWKRKPDPNSNKSWYDRDAKTFQAEKFREGACDNCGALTHDNKACVKRPHQMGAKWTGKHIAPDEKIENFELGYDGK